MLVDNNYYEIKNYNKKTLFSSFLPGISGIKGIPIWSFYVNRGQCITSFGSRDKDHSIMEFYPAHQSYQRTETMGFRTFLKVNGAFAEVFENQDAMKNMYIGMNDLIIEEILVELGLRVRVRYATLPEEKLGGLMRNVEITNVSEKHLQIEYVDGMAEMIPYGISLEDTKEMMQTAKAWMEVNDLESRIPRIKVRASLEDSAQVLEVKGFHFAFAQNENTLLPAIVDKEILFGYDSALKRPENFVKTDVGNLIHSIQITQNDVPCCFFVGEKILAPGERIELQEVYGVCDQEAELNKFIRRAERKSFFEKKWERVAQLVQEITKPIETRTANTIFDAYCKQTYLDNLLRGGYPIKLGRHIFYVYSRKHGDIERDYNYFAMQAEPYSQGNGNFRDVNQNRRCDVAFAPFVEDKNIAFFYNCIQLDGYNPLGIERSTYRMEEAVFNQMDCLSGKERKAVDKIVTRSYTPGELYQVIQDEEKFICLLNASQSEEQTRFLEGYWTDHWTYNLDLVEAYLAIYPDYEKRLLFEDALYTYPKTVAKILPRHKRYIKTENGIRQYTSIEMLATKKGDTSCDLDCPSSAKEVDRKGKVLHSTLVEKIFLLCTTKVAALDAYGMGIEMEGGKPGWYDALNGMPGILGSSMAETYELERNLEWLIDKIEVYRGNLSMPIELRILAEHIYRVMQKQKDEWENELQVIGLWEQLNTAKEQYWLDIEKGFSGEYVKVTPDECLEILRMYQRVVTAGIKKAISNSDGMAPTYFYYEVMEYEEENGIHPTAFKMHTVPFFLEGPVHALKIKQNTESRKALYAKVRESSLYDTKLRMYRVNESLREASYELGRARAFTPGWLENESIWLHMEYKYILELLKNNMYEEFFEDFHHALIPFLDESVYGRSLLENSSFIASSANANKKIIGKGFVARLSGSTAEFLQMWQIMMFGANPFYIEDGILKLQLTPVLPDYLVHGQKEITATFLGSIQVVYHMEMKMRLVPGEYVIASYQVDGKEYETITGALCEDIRNRKVKRIDVTII